MKGLRLINPIERSQLGKETQRVYEICDGCRRCFNLCPSFNTLFDRIDAQESDVSKLAPADFEQVAHECYYCKLCFNHCPYTPPHQYEIDFPRLMLAWKKQLAAEKGVRWRDRLLTKTDLIGAAGSLAAPIANWMMERRWVRAVLDRLLGLHRDRQMLPFARETFVRWWRRTRRAASSGSAERKVVLFASCLVNYQATDVGKATVQVLEKNKIRVVVPELRCCGMPAFDIGDTGAIVKTAKAMIRGLRPWLDDGYDVVVPVPSCSLMFKREYPYLLPGDDTAQLAQRTFDVCEYLMRLKREGELAMDFPRKPGRVAYQVPCHLRDQNIGLKSKDLMECAGAQVEVIERCSGHDGTWAAKTEFFDLSMSIAGKAVRDIRKAPADLIASDCPLAGLQLDQAGASAHAGGTRTLHPIQIIRDAYGLPSSGCERDPDA
ncbi:MAG TPA: heterodisulfide reductase-related iron-sulfur binding cluster [Nitrospiraceae bacterium]|jgi:Fe-S oxidoreductase|nr:heterodisulfide reductase-related iron-sulfur binding cluster [Nitrospiraceae bacterium]